LAGGDPVIFGFSVYEFFDSAEMADTGILQMPGQDRMAGGHAVVLCGYNDATQLFLVRNSWGADWGLPTARGHFRMPYEYVMNPDLSSDFWTIQSITTNP
jgi:C1A family cysteine protease